MSLQMAIMHQESHFRSNARPSDHNLLHWLSTGNRSSAVGYAQVLNSTWASYLKANHLSFASRSDFFAATDFIGWYVNQLHQQLGLALSDGLHLYLAYHEGVTGYRKSMYKRKPWLISVARKVQRQATRYQQQLVNCHLSG